MFHLINRVVFAVDGDVVAVAVVVVIVAGVVAAVVAAMKFITARVTVFQMQQSICTYFHILSLSQACGSCAHQIHK